MSGLGYRQANGAQGESKRVPRPFDQADIDGEPVENACAENVPFFIPAGSNGARFDRSNAGGGTAVDTPLRYGDVSASSFGDDSERERDA
jgi:hypothetical protein